jgi:beta-lactamase regulating signal transducer with metallopeptidase domain
MDTGPSQAPGVIPPLQNQNANPGAYEPPFWQTGLFMAWIAGMAAFSLAISIRMVRLRRQQLAQKGRTPPEWFQKILIHTARRMKLKRIPAVIFSENASGPAVFGLFRPSLLLPEGYLEKLSDEQATHVLLHELCHLRRGDLLLHWFSLTLQVVYWFNPLLLWTRRQMRHVCEICCDLSVANILREKTPAYRNTILDSARELLTENVNSPLGLLGIFEESFRLVSRLKWLEKTTWKHRKRKTAATVLSGLVMVFCVMPMNGLSRPDNQNESLSIHPDNTSSVPGGTTTVEEPETDQPMLYIEALIVETNMDIDHEAPAEGITIISAPEITIDGKTFSDIQTAAQKMSSTPDVKILSTPKMLTYLNNEKCSIEIRAGSPGGAVVSEQPRFLLEITPRLLEGGRIHQHVLLEITRETDSGITSDVMEDDVEFRESDMVMLAREVPDAGATTQSKVLMFLKARIIESLAEIELPYES